MRKPLLWVLILLGLGLPASANEPRAARSVHLRYPAPPATAFYNQMTIERSTPGSYFMAAGFEQGYFGLQELGDGKKIAIFSVWDASAGDDPKAVAADRQVRIVDSVDGAIARRFGGEGTGAQCLYPCDWKIGQAYTFCVTARLTSQEKWTAFSGWLYDPAAGAWKKLATFATVAPSGHVGGLYSFVEDFRRDGNSATQVRRAMFGPGWVREAGKEWRSLDSAQFTASSSPWEAADTIDAGALKDGRFYLQTGGTTVQQAKLDATLLRKQPADRPDPPPPEEAASVDDSGGKTR